MQVQQAHLADINSWQTCIYLSVLAVRTVVRAGVCQGPESKSGDAQGASGRLDLVLSVDVSVSRSPGRPPRLDIARPAVETLIFPSAARRPINAQDPQNGSSTSSKGNCPNSNPLEKRVPTGHHTYPCALGSLFGSLFGIQAREHCPRRPRSRLHRDGPVATLGIRPPDNAFHGKNCLVPQPNLRRSLLGHIPLHRRCW